MAEQDTEDTRLPAPRRGARPFAGPAGAPSATRPLLKPAAPASRPMRGVVASPPAVARATPAASSAASSLGAAPPSPSAGVPVATAAEIGAMGELASAVDMPPAGQAETQLAAQPAPAMPTEPTWYDDSADAAPVSEAGAEAGAVMAGLDPMTALDPFDALHTPWDVTDIDVAPAPSSSPEQDSGVSPGAPPLDELSLGSGVDAQELWGDDIVALPWPSDDAGREHAAGAVGLDEAAHADASAADAAAAEVNWADAPAIPSADAVIADDAAATEALGEAISTSPGADATAMTAHVEPPGMPEAGGWPGPLLAEYAPYVSEPPAISPVAIDPTQDTVEGVVPPNRHRVSAVLDRLAERVRDGEIDVTSVAPDATDAGILALVLAALLGGSSTSR